MTIVKTPPEILFRCGERNVPFVRGESLWVAYVPLMHGFLGTQATFREDFNLVLQIAMALALIVGMILARKKKFQAHKYCQSSVLILNLFLIFSIMFPSFRREVFPHFSQGFHDSYYEASEMSRAKAREHKQASSGISSKSLSSSFASETTCKRWFRSRTRSSPAPNFRLGYYAIPAVHASLGMIAEILGLYIILVAGTNLIPKALKFKRYKPWMRTELVLWCIVLGFGIGTYGRWYIFPGGKAHRLLSSSLTAQASVKVSFRNFEFTPKEVTVVTGNTVEWVDEGGRHKIVADDNTFESPVLFEGDHYKHRFDHPGIFFYHCDFHGDKGGKDMAGVIKVLKF